MGIKIGAILTISAISLVDFVLLSSNVTLAQSRSQCDRYARNYAERNASGGALSGAAEGAATGALIGAILGGGRGAGDGAAAGAAFGAIAGGASRERDKDYLYNLAYDDCMRGYRDSRYRYRRY